MQQPRRRRLVPERQAISVGKSALATMSRVRLVAGIGARSRKIEARTPRPRDRRRLRGQLEVRELSEGGMPVGFLEGGFLSWEAEALPIERPD
jgi:thioredoxin 1/putative thioredoxin